MKFGYARTTTGEQNLAIQIDELESAGAETIFQDINISGSAVLKPAYGDLLRTAKPGDEIIIWRLDRLSRSLITLMTDFIY